MASIVVCVAAVGDVMQRAEGQKHGWNRGGYSWSYDDEYG